MPVTQSLNVGDFLCLHVNNGVKAPTARIAEHYAVDNCIAGETKQVKTIYNSDLKYCFVFK